MPSGAAGSCGLWFTGLRGGQRSLQLLSLAHSRPLKTRVNEARFLEGPCGSVVDDVPYEAALRCTPPEETGGLLGPFNAFLRWTPRVCCVDSG